MPDDRRESDDAVADYAATFLQTKLGEQTVRRPRRMSIRVLTGPDEGAVFEVAGRKITGGRGHGHHIQLSDASVSNTHFELCPSDLGVVLRDLGSRNGLWCGKARIAEATLHDSAEFFVGNCKLRLESVSESEVVLSPSNQFGDLHGQSQAMREMFAVLDRLAPTPLTAIIGGETGTGKELAAKAIHQKSGRSGRFVVVDCASLPRDLAESMLLGHRRGAFTGATEDRAGAFEEADKGTLFLDEIGELPLETQPKLLRVLEQREVLRIGETLPRPVDVRVLAATHRDLRSMVAQEAFRLDLYQRLAQVEIDIPPLRERIDDVALLASVFAAEVGDISGEVRALTSQAVDLLKEQPWEGNVRQLKNALVKAAYLCSGAEIGADDLCLQQQGPRAADTSLSDDELASGTLQDAVRKAQRRYCAIVLSQTGRDTNAAADRAGYSVRRFRDVLQRLGLRQPRG